MAERIGVTTASVTGLLDRLVTAGYVTRSPNPCDRRSILVTPTAGIPGPLRFLQLITGVLQRHAAQTPEQAEGGLR